MLALTVLLADAAHRLRPCRRGGRIGGPARCRNAPRRASPALDRGAAGAMPARPAKPCDEPTFLIPGLPLSMAAMNLIYALVSPALLLRSAATETGDRQWSFRAILTRDERWSG